MIKDIRIYPAFNNLRKETVKAKILTTKGCWTASVPTGTSKGEHEAVELPLKRIEKIFPAVRRRLLRKDERNQKLIDSTLQKMGGRNFERIGGNLALAISIAVARAGTDGLLCKGCKNGQFPIPLVNVVGGGAHGGECDFQEFLVAPARAKSPLEAAKTAIEVWSIIGHEMRAHKILTGKNIEGAWTTKLNDFKVLDFLSQIAADWDLKIGIDCAASRFWDGQVYKYKSLWRILPKEKQVDFITEIAKKYRLFYIEDPVQENDFDGFAELNSRIGGKCLVTSDDLYCTNPQRLQKGIEKNATNATIIKPNQAGTLSLAEEAVRLAKQAGMTIIPSHRSRETADSWISDLAVAWSAPLIKIGMNDMTKFNRLIELWGEMPKPKMAAI